MEKEKGVSRMKRLVMISQVIRRDLEAPLRYYREVEVIHFYQKASYKDIYPDEFGKKTIQYRGFFDLLKKIVRAKPDIIQGAEPYAFPAGIRECLAAYVSSLILRVPLFFPMLENRPVEIKFGGRYRFLIPFLRLYLKVYAKRAKLVIYLNKGAKRNLLNVGVREAKLKHLLYGTWGVDVDEFSPPQAGEKRRGQKGDVVLFVGNLSEGKGIWDLYQAMKKVRRDIGSVKWIIVGNGPCQKALKKKIYRERLQEEFILKGTVKNRDLPPYFRAAAITVTPSITTPRWEEQVGMVNIQSMACGTPVISTTSGAIPEYVKDDETGLLVPERNSDALAAAILKLLTNKDLRRNMGLKARQYALKRYDAKRNVKKAEEIILKLLGENCY